MNSACKFGGYLRHTALGQIHMNLVRPDLRMFSCAALQTTQTALTPPQPITIYTGKRRVLWFSILF
jgi:hypothetical protein